MQHNPIGSLKDNEILMPIGVNNMAADIALPDNDEGTPAIEPTKPDAPEADNQEPGNGDPDPEDNDNINDVSNNNKNKKKKKFVSRQFRLKQRNKQKRKFKFSVCVSHEGPLQTCQ